jgi:hypothetical protein
LERLLNLRFFETKISHPAQARGSLGSPTVKNNKIRVARKLDLIGPN